MNILIATHDFVRHKAHLMPWRIIDEVAGRLRAASFNVIVVSLAHSPEDGKNAGTPDDVVQLNKGRDRLADELCRIVASHEIDAMFWPLAWREPGWRIEILRPLRIAKIGYLPGGVFGLRSCIYALRKLGAMATAPYLVDSIVPKRRLSKLASRAGVTDLITFSELTATVAQAAGWKPDRVHCILPGKDSHANDENGGTRNSNHHELDGEPFFLFMGPPSGIRGIYELLEAFEIAASRNSAVRLVCLFRPDDELDSEKIKRVIQKSDYRARIHTEWRSLERATLNSYIRSSTALVLPFVLVPSEIPLAIIEALAWSKPVITTSPGGTGHFVRRFGFAPPVGDTRSMADAMLLLTENANVYAQKERQAQQVFAELRDWSDMANAWIDVVRMATSTGNPT